MTNNDDLALKAEQCANILENIAGFEPDDIDEDNVDLRFDLDGMDTGCTVSIVEQCQHAADALRALLAERDADKKRIAELEASHAKLRESMAAIHNTIRMDGAGVSLSVLFLASKRAYEESAAAAGINLEVEE